MPEYSEELRRIISDPLLLEAAWRRVQTWLHYDGWAPEPEYTQWCTNHNKMIANLSQRFEESPLSAAPLSMPLLPYPKKDGTLRHYVQPSVSAQVVFCAVVMLLAPWMELRMQPFSLGHRWFRGIRPDFLKERRWKLVPFSLNDSRVYQPYRRAYGLLRRCAHWSVKSMLGLTPERDGATGCNILPEDLPTEMLPPWVQRNYWTPEKGKGKAKGYWGQADLVMAYPSVRMGQLRQRIREILMLDDELKEDELEIFQKRLKGSLRGFSADQRRLILKPELRLAAGDLLVDLLSRVRYDNRGIGDRLWLPRECLPEGWCPPDPAVGEPGLPTGLIVSGLLLNVYLYQLDRQLKAWCDKRRGKRAVFRFVDDIIFIARKPEDIADALVTLDRALGGSGTGPGGELANPVETALDSTSIPHESQAPQQRTSNLFIKDEKVQPDGLKQWWSKHSSDVENISEATLDELTADDMRRFVTHLIEHLSVLGQETLFDRFGEGARRRLRDIHALVHFRMGEGEIPPETLHAFASNRLVRAWLPEESADEDARLLYEMRRTVEAAIRNTPWKAHLWRSIIRLYARTTLGGTSVNKIAPREELNNVLGWLSIVEGEPSRWEVAWPGQQQRMTSQVCVLWLSYLRATFWRNLADVLRTVDRLIEPGGGALREGTVWGSPHWTFRAFTEEGASVVMNRLNRIETFARRLYGDGTPHKRGQRVPSSEWEIEALCLAVIASQDRRDFVTTQFVTTQKEWMSTQSEADQLRLPHSLPVLQKMPTVRWILESNGRLASPNECPMWELLYLTRLGQSSPHTLLTGLPYFSVDEQDSLQRAFSIGVFPRVEGVNLRKALRSLLDKEKSRQNRYLCWHHYRALYLANAICRAGMQANPTEREWE